MRARNGISIFNSGEFRRSVEQESLPFLEKGEIKEDLKHYLSLAAANQTFSKDMPDQDKQ